MTTAAKPVTVQVFAAPSMPGHSPWEAATSFLRQQLQHRFGGAA